METIDIARVTLAEFSDLRDVFKKNQKTRHIVPQRSTRPYGLATNGEFNLTNVAYIVNRFIRATRRPDTSKDSSWQRGWKHDR